MAKEDKGILFLLFLALFTLLAQLSVIVCFLWLKYRELKVDCLVLHCAFLLRRIFASLARANERARVQNVRDFPQSKLDSVINARFLLNEHGDPHFLFYKFTNFLNK